MALISVSSLSKSFGADELFSGVTFGIEDRDKVGLVGVNGCGKTTLMKILLGLEPSDSGEIYIRKNCRISYLEQQTSSVSLKPLYDEVLSVYSDLIELEKKIEEMNGKTDMTEEEASLAAKLHETYVSGGGLEFRSRVSSALKGLGFSENDFSLSVSKLSGGQITRLLLCKTLLSGADMIFLDEPTNHLDIESVQWLEKFLIDYKGAFLVISHDRYFLDRVTNKTFGMGHGKLAVYPGNYSVYVKLKEERELTVKRNYDNTMREVKRIEGIIEQQRRWNRERNIRTAESKQKMIDRMTENLEAPEAAEKHIRFKFGINKASANDVLKVSGVSKSFGDKTVFFDVNMDVKKSDRVFLLGSNGCGKSTLFKIIMKRLTANEGTVSVGTGVEIGYYDQMQSNLSENKDVFTEIYDAYPKMLESEVRNALAAFLFRGDDVFKTISDLSGGERARVLLCKLMLSGANFLILDEPTNHLDIESCEALESALSDYEGTLLVVSHDRYFINKLAEKIYYLDGSVRFYDGNYDYFLEKSAMFEETKPAVCKKAEKVNDYKLEKQKKSQFNRLNGQLSRCEQSISELEAEIAENNNLLCDPEIAGDYVKTMEITEQVNALSAQLDELMEKWQELSEQLEEF